MSTGVTVVSREYVEVLATQIPTTQVSNEIVEVLSTTGPASTSVNMIFMEVLCAAASMDFPTGNIPTVIVIT